jgi:hypothetical protein
MRDNSTFATFARLCKRAGGRNLVNELLDPFRALQNPAPDVAAALKAFQNRPWYSADELAMLWPLIAVGLAGSERGFRPSPEQVYKRLKPLLPRVKSWGGDYEFEWNGERQEWFIVQSVQQIARLRFTQRDFERVMYV